MRRDNGDLILFKIVGIGLVLFYLFIFIGVNFVTVGVDNEETKKYKRKVPNKLIEC